MFIEHKPIVPKVKLFCQYVQTCLFLSHVLFLYMNYKEIIRNADPDELRTLILEYAETNEKFRK